MSIMLSCIYTGVFPILKGLNCMIINIKPMTTCIDQLMQEIAITKSQQAALKRITEIVHHAKSTAYARPPQHSFTYRESIFSALAEELTPKQIDALSEVGIELIKAPGSPNHQIKMSFQS